MIFFIRNIINMTENIDLEKMCQDAITEICNKYDVDDFEIPDFYLTSEKDFDKLNMCIKYKYVGFMDYMTDDEICDGFDSLTSGDYDEVSYYFKCILHYMMFDKNEYVKSFLSDILKPAIENYLKFILDEVMPTLEKCETKKDFYNMLEKFEDRVHDDKLLLRGLRYITFFDPCPVVFVYSNANDIKLASRLVEFHFREDTYSDIGLRIADLFKAYLNMIHYDKFGDMCDKKRIPECIYIYKHK